MNAQMVLTMGQDALLMLLMVSSPVLGAALLVGLLVSLFQAVTQIHEATLAFVPKLIAVIAVFAIAGPWMLTMLVEYIRRTLEAIFTGFGGVYVCPRVFVARISYAGQDCAGFFCCSRHAGQLAGYATHRF